MPNPTGLNKATTMFWASIIARAWEDDQFKNALMKNPKKKLKELGFTDFYDADGNEINIVVADATDGKSCSYDKATKTLTFYLPQKPACGQLTFEGKFTAGCGT